MACLFLVLVGQVWDLITICITKPLRYPNFRIPTFSIFPISPSGHWIVSFVKGSNGKVYSLQKEMGKMGWGNMGILSHFSTVFLKWGAPHYWRQLQFSVQTHSPEKL